MIPASAPRCVPPARAEALLDVVGNHLLELRSDRRTAEGRGLAAVDEDRSGGRLAGSRKRDADVGVLGFAGTVDDAAHHRDLEFLDARILLAPDRHVAAKVVLDGLGEFLEHGGCGAPATRAGCDDRHELAESHGLEQFLRHLHLAGAITAGFGGKRYADRVADALLQQDAHGCGRGDDALGAHAGLGQTEMQRVVRAARQFGIDGDQVLHLADLGRQDDAVARQPDLLGEFGRQERRLDDRLSHHLHRGQRRAGVLVLVHQACQQVLVERPPVHADPHRLVVPDRGFDDRRELAVLLLLEADVPRVDAVLGQSLGAGRMIGEELVADIVEVADQRHVDAEPRQAVADAGHGRRALVAVDGDAHDLRSGTVEGGDLCDRRVDVGRVGVGHRLHDDRRRAADQDAADVDADGLAARRGTLPGGLLDRRNGVHLSAPRRFGMQFRWRSTSAMSSVKQNGDDPVSAGAIIGIRTRPPRPPVPFR